jgi:excisionase family DNA binding protein
MRAYDIQQRRQSAELLQPDSVLQPRTRSRPGRGRTGASAAAREDADIRTGEASMIDALLDHLADRLATALLGRLSGEPDDGDEWLDSRQAAEYLGLHRDTLRRLAAARTIPAEQAARGCKLYFRRASLDEWRRSGGRSRHLAAVANAA